MGSFYVAAEKSTGSQKQQAAAELGAARNLATYATALDRRDDTLLRECFTADSVAVYAGDNACEGIEAVTAYVKAALRPFSSTQHTMGRTRILAIASGEVTAETYCVAYLYQHQVGKIWSRGLRYQDILTHVGTQWKVRHRDQAVDWMTVTDALSPDSLWPGSVALKGRDSND